MKVETYDEAVRLLLAGGVGVMATDTVYGLVARAANPKAVARMYALKARESKPGTVIAANTQQLIDLGIDPKYVETAAAFWPGQVSVETPLSDELAYLHQGTGRQGFRVVNSQRVRKVLEATGPLVTSSANQPGEAPANVIAEARAYFKDDVDFYIEAGDRSDFPPSTILRVTDTGVDIIRQGAVHVTGLQKAEPHCPFCLDNKLLTTPVVYEDTDAYITRAKQDEERYLLVPKQHAEHVTELGDDWWAVCKRLLAQLPIPADSFNISVNQGTNAGQLVTHTHFWVIPRKAGLPSSGMGLSKLISTVDAK